jgi:hypothetical protein
MELPVKKAPATAETGVGEVNGMSFPSPSEGEGEPDS